MSRPRLCDYATSYPRTVPRQLWPDSEVVERSDDFWFLGYSVVLVASLS
jgi:hypothetical protein